MNALLNIGLSNAAVVALLAAVVLPLARWAGKPTLTHAVCVLLLLKLVMPPLVHLPVWTIHAPRDRDRSAGVTSEQQIPPVQIRVTEDYQKATVAAPSPGSATEIPAVASDAGLDGVQDSFRSAVTSVNRPAIASAPVSSTKVLPSPSQLPSPSHWTLLCAAARDQWPQWVFLAWFSTAAAFGAIAGARIVRLRRALNRTAVDGPPIGAEITLLAERLVIRKPPRVQFVSASIPPMLVALFGRPRLVIPIAFWHRLDGPRRRALLLHELAHLRRGDHWVRYLESLSMCLYWWHPAVWFVRGMLRDAEEQCCDAWAVWAMPGESRTYMSTLLDAVDFLSQSSAPRIMATPVLASGMGQFHRLHRRLIMVREQKVQRRLGLWGVSGVIVASALALPLGAEVTRGEDNPAQARTPTTGNAFPGPGVSSQTPPAGAPAVPTQPSALPIPDTAPPAIGGAPADPAPPSALDFNVQSEGSTFISIPRAHIRSLTSGTIQKVSCKEGQRVKKGAVLVQLDATELQRSVAGAERIEKASQQRYDVMIQMQKAGQAAPQELAAAKLDLDKASDVLQQRQAALDATRIVAPFDGVVEDLETNVGSTIFPGDSIVTVANVSEASIHSAVPNDIRLQIGDPAVIFSEDGKRLGSGEVVSIGRENDATGLKSVRVRIVEATVPLTDLIPNTVTFHVYNADLR